MSKYQRIIRIALVSPALVFCVISLLSGNRLINDSPRFAMGLFFTAGMAASIIWLHWLEGLKRD